MVDESGSDETLDIHGYIKHQLVEEGIDLENQPHEARDFIMKSAAWYFLFHSDPSEIQDYEYHYFTAVRIEELVIEAHDKFHEEAEKWFKEIGEVSDMDDEELLDLAERAARFTIGNSVTLIYSMAFELIHDLMEELLPTVLREDIDRDSTGRTLVSQIGSYTGKADLLRACSVLDSDTRDIVRHVREVRRTLVHDVEERYTLTLLDDLNEMNRIHDAISMLFEEVYGFPAYEYVDVE